VADGGDVGARGSGKPLHFSGKDSSIAICVVQVYFLGWAITAQVLTSTVVSARLSGKAHKDSDHIISIAIVHWCLPWW